MTINITVTDETVQPEIYLGRQGEKNYREIVFDLSALITKYGAGTATLCHQRSQDLAPYVVEESTSDTLTWVVSDTDTAFPGIGYAEFRYTFGNDNLSKSTIFATNVKESLNDDIVVPEPLQSYFDKMMEYISSHGNAGAGLTGDVISALLDCFAHVAWIDDDGQDYYDALEDALEDIYWKVANILSHCSTNNSTTSLVKGTSYHATITPSVGYTMEGATVSVVMGGTDITSTAYDDGVINVDSVTGKLVISAIAEELPVTLESIDAVYTQTGTVYPTDSLDSLKDDLVVTATYSDTSSATVPAADYTLSGTLAVGTSTITATCSGKTDTFTVTVTKVPELDSISATYTQSGTVYTDDTLDSLKTDLVVTATYSDSSSATVPAADYTLSGTLTAGTSTITVTYGGETDTFTVTVTQATAYLYNWDFTQSLDDLVNGTTAEVSAGSGHSAPTRTSSGLVFDEATQVVYFGNLGGMEGKTIEFDIASASFAGSTSYHMRYLMLNHGTSSLATGTGPLVWRKDNGWSAYGYEESTGNQDTRKTWGSVYGNLSGSSSAILNYMSGKTVKIVMSSNGQSTLYIDDTLIGTQSSIYFTNSGDRCQHLWFGGIGSKDQSKGDQCYNLTLSGLRIYANE